MLLDQVEVATMYLPIKVPNHTYQLYWDSRTTHTIAVQQQILSVGGNFVQAVENTKSMLRAAFGHRFRIEDKQPVVLLAAADAPLKDGCYPVGNAQTFDGLIRERGDPQSKYIFKQWLHQKPAKDL